MYLYCGCLELLHTFTCTQKHICILSVDYAEQYSNLQVRCEVLESEASDIHEKIQDIDVQIEQEMKQVQQIELEQERIRNQVTFSQNICNMQHML